MDVLNNRAVAAILCALVIAVSSVVGAGTSLGTIRRQTEATFSCAGMGIQGDLNDISAQAFNITVIAGRYLQQDYAGIADVHAKRDALNSAVTPREKNRAAEELLVAVNMLRRTLESLELSTQDRHLLDACMVEINSRVMLISASGYNQAALRFNQTLERFPANILGRAAGVRPLELYE